MDEEILHHMMARVELCRRLARETTDERTARALFGVADEGQADIERLFAQLRSARQPGS
jgi:hypothetical protein